MSIEEELQKLRQEAKKEIKKLNEILEAIRNHKDSLIKIIFKSKTKPKDILVLL